jgi:hypothetical protein
MRNGYDPICPPYRRHFPALAKPGRSITFISFQKVYILTLTGPAVGIYNKSCDMKRSI